MTSPVNGPDTTDTDPTPPLVSNGVQMVTVDDFNALAIATDQRLDALEAEYAALAPKPPVTPPVVAKPLWGTGDPSAFKGVATTAHRIYYGLGKANGNNPDLAQNVTKADKARGAASHISINRSRDPGVTEWTTYDTAAAAPYKGAVQTTLGNGGMLINNHEPDNGKAKGTPNGYKQWHTQASQYWRAQVPGIKIAVCLMAWTGRKGGPGFPAWCPSPNEFDVFGIDGYGHQDTDTAASVFGNALAYARSIGKPLYIFEHGQEMWRDQAKWLHSMDDFIQSNHDVLGADYWNGGTAQNASQGHNYHLTPAALNVYGQILTAHYALSTTKAL